MLEQAANTVSGLELRDIGEDGHAVANRLWKIAAHMRARARKNVRPEVIRTWARQNGYRVNDTGRVPHAIVLEYYRRVSAEVDTA
jgi:hypothetical protein